MQKHLQRFVELLTKMDLEGLMKHYLDSNEADNVVQLGFMFKQGQLKASSFDFYQELATSFITNKGLPSALIAKIQTSNTLSFFTPALQVANNFNKADDNQRCVMHYLFSHCDEASNKQLANQPPFNYLRSMMLFGSNFALRDGLCRRDQQNLTPIEAYLFTHKNFNPLAQHELTALLALMEIETTQQAIASTNYSNHIKVFSLLCRDQAIITHHELQRIIVIATYYSLPIDQVINDITQIAE
jgi:hypothetical protein